MGAVLGRTTAIPRRIVVWLLWLYLAVLALIAFWPTPVDKPVSKQLNASINQAHHEGAPRWFTYSFVEASANVALFIPFGVLVALLLPPKRWWLAIPAGFLTSCCIELGQLLFLSARFATVQDVVVNTGGTVLGAVGVFAVRLLLSQRQARLG